MTSIKEFRNKEPREWQQLLAERRAAWRDLRFKAATRQLAKVHQIRNIKQDIARLETLLHASSVIS